MSFTICLAPAQTIEYSQGGGHLWVYLNWALALRAAGCRVSWLEGVDLSERANARRQRHGTNVHHSARFHAVNPCVAADGLGVLPDQPDWNAVRPGVVLMPPTGRSKSSHLRNEQASAD
ncbi:MAG: hypothetical protein DMD99_08610 [Candidatus Rokuibacteriota bacterium]|nr:MAG: hypothetical protein DMD99_08610 [Candidatus Rokubacteria bacterium]